MDYKKQIEELINNPERLIQKKPFYRGGSSSRKRFNSLNVNINERLLAELPDYDYKTISQSQYISELDPYSHRVLFDNNVPSICIKAADGEYYEIEFIKAALPYQRCIKDKKVLHMCGNPMSFTLMQTEATDVQNKNFTTFKQYFDLRGQNGMLRKLVDAQLSVGDAGLLYYINRKGEIKSRVISYLDGYVLCPHNDNNGERLIESVYYKNEETGIEYIDSYDDTYIYNHVLDYNSEENGWVLTQVQKHGFSEIPLITKRGDVAWNEAQSIIETLEILYNIFIVIQKRHGWGILYIKGNFNDTGKRIAGSVVLQDKNSMGDEQSDAKFLTPPTPQGMIDTMALMEEMVQKASKTTFLLPKDIKTGGDISGVVVQLTQSLDIEEATQNINDYQNVIDKMVRLFKEGLAIELVNKGINPNAITEFDEIQINASLKVWIPKSTSEYTQILTTLKGAGLLSVETGLELSEFSAPNEKQRIQKEKELDADIEQNNTETTTENIIVTK